MQAGEEVEVAAGEAEGYLYIPGLAYGNHTASGIVVSFIHAAEAIEKFAEAVVAGVLAERAVVVCHVADAAEVVGERIKGRNRNASAP